MRHALLLILSLCFSSCIYNNTYDDSLVPNVASKGINTNNPLRREPLIPSTTASIGCIWKDFWTKEPGTGFLYMDCSHQPIIPYENNKQIYVQTNSGSTLFMEFIPYMGGTPIDEVSLFMEKNNITSEECIIQRRADEFGTARGVVRLVIEPKEQKMLPPGEVPCKGYSIWNGQEKYFEFQDGKPVIFNLTLKKR